MKVLYSDAHEQHSPARLLVKGVSTPSREIPQRAEILLDAVRAAGYPVVAPDDFGPEVRASIHTAGYLEFLERAHGEWQALGDGAPEARKRHMSTVFLRPTILMRYGAVEWAGVKIYLKGKDTPVAVMQMPKNDRRPWTAKVTTKAGVLSYWQL